MANLFWPSRLGAFPAAPGALSRAWFARHATGLAIALIALLVGLTQLGGLAREVIDPDEPSFILMGADVAKGHLPFVHAFDLKPPLIFLLLGGLFSIFGKSLIAVRLAGDLFIVATAALVFLVSRRITGTASALGGALLYVVMASLEFGQPTYSELPAAAFVVAAAALLCRGPVSVSGGAAIGALVALAVLTRTNLYPVAVATGLLLLAGGRLRSAPAAPFAWLAYGLAGLVPPAMLVLAYAWAGEIAVLKLAMIDVPLAYSAQAGPAELFRSHVAQFYVWVTMAPAVLIPAVLLVVAGAVASAWRLWREREAFAAWRLCVLAVLTAAAGASVLVSGAAYPHYWLQVLPFFGVLAACALAATARLPHGSVLALLLVAVPVGSALAARLPEALALARTSGPHDDSFDIAAAARHIADSGIARPRLWAWSKHLVHWYLDAPQPSRASVHPDNLGRTAIIETLAEHGYVTSDEVGRIMASLPDFVVTDRKGHGIGWVRRASKPVDAWLARNYRRDAEFGDVLVYRRIGGEQRSKRAL